MNHPFLSVLIPVRNEEAHIAGLLEQLVGQDYPKDKLEILVFDGGSGDATRQIAGQFASQHYFIRLLDNPKLLSSAARNLGARRARGEIVVYLDGHCLIPDKNLLKNVAAAFEKSGADCLGRAQPLIPGEKRLTQAIALARGSALGHNPASFIYSDFQGFIDPTSCGAAYRKEVFQKVGYFDESFDACEDVEFNLRVNQAGLKCYISPGLKVGYFPRESLTGLFKQMFRYGYGRYKLFRKHRPIFPILAALPALYLLLLVMVLIAGFLNSQFIAFFYLGALFCALPVSVYSLVLALRKKLQLFPHLLAVFPIIHFGISLGFWKSLLTNLRGKP
jgi:succinoglycan biosynthesis protein ExoA